MYVYDAFNIDKLIYEKIGVEEKYYEKIKLDLDFNNLRGGKTKYYYHGSKQKIDVLLPKPSKVVNMEKVVFATDTIWLSIFFISDARDADIELGFVKGKPYILEQYEGAFDKYLKNVSGYIYYLDKSSFDTDSRLGLQNHEFISKTKVSIVKTVKVNNLYKQLKKYNVNMVSFDKKIKCIDRLTV